MSYSTVVATSPVHRALQAGMVDAGVISVPSQPYVHQAFGVSYSPPKKFAGLTRSTSLSSMSALRAFTAPRAHINTTKVLELLDFDEETQSKDIHALFQPWAGNFGLKWVNKSSCYVVFADANIAKEAWLSRMNEPLTHLGASAELDTYTGPDTDTIVADTAKRIRTKSNASATGMSSHSRSNSLSSFGAGLNNSGVRGGQGIWRQSNNVMGRRAAGTGAGAGNGSLRGFQLIDGDEQGTPNTGNVDVTERSSPIVGDAAKRFIAAGLGSKIPGLTLPQAPGLAGTTIEEVPEVTTPLLPSHPSD